MKLLLLLSIFLVISNSANAQSLETVTLPRMERAGLHRIYADTLLRLALELSREKYGPYQIIQQEHQTVIRRQLQELEAGRLSAAIAMPSPEWLRKSQIIPFPIMKGLASYRLFLSLDSHQARLNKVESLDDLITLKIGQGNGWSTGRILEDNGFQVVYGGTYQSLFPMLTANRFQLLMRGAYEIVPEYEAYKSEAPGLQIVDNIAVYTYLPMYFFVSHKQPKLAARLEYGLKEAHTSGKFDELFDRYFGETLKLLYQKQRKTFYLKNSNIKSSYFFELDEPYLLESIIRMEKERTQKNSYR